MKPDINKVWYICSPYSSAPPWYLQDTHKYVDDFKKMMIDIRHREIQSIATKLILEGYILIEPIASCHFKQEHFQLPEEYGYWKRRDRTLIEHSDGVIVAMMPGWHKSTGVTDEIAHAEDLGKEVWYLEVGEQYQFHNDMIRKRS
jgi:hypothetical protein